MGSGSGYGKYPGEHTSYYGKVCYLCRQAIYLGQQLKLHLYLREFGWIGIVSIRQNLKSKWKEKGIKMIMVGYAEDGSEETYQMFNPKMKKIIRSCTTLSG
jgi:hypothetical protein